MQRPLCGLLACVVALAVANAANADETTDVIKKAIKANGGKGVLQKYTAIEMKGSGTVMAGGMKLEYSGHWQLQFPAKYRIDIETDINGTAFKITHVVNGKEGWQKLADNAAMKIPDTQREIIQTQMKVDATNQLVPLLDAKKYTLSKVGEEKVNGKKAVCINVTSKNGLDVNLYFSTDSGLLVKQQYQTKSDTGKEVTQTVFLSDYKKVSKDGSMFPRKVEVKQDGKLYVTAKFDEVTPRKKIDDKTFAKPE